MVSQVLLHIHFTRGHHLPMYVGRDQPIHARVLRNRLANHQLVDIVPLAQVNKVGRVVDQSVVPPVPLHLGRWTAADGARQHGRIALVTADRGELSDEEGLGLLEVVGGVVALGGGLERVEVGGEDLVGVEARSRLGA